MIALTTNTRGETVMTMIKDNDYSAMSGPELAKAYNAMAAKTGANPVKKFKDLETGIARCKSIASASTPAPLAKTGKAATIKEKKGGIVEEFKLRAGTNRVEMIRALHDSFGKQVLESDLVKKCKFTEKVSLSAVVAGLEWRIEKSNLPYVIRKEKKDGKATIGFHPKR